MTDEEWQEYQIITNYSFWKKKIIIINDCESLQIINSDALHGPKKE